MVQLAIKTKIVYILSFTISITLNEIMIFIESIIIAKKKKNPKPITSMTRAS